MTGIYKAVLTNAKAMKRLETIRKGLDKAKIPYTVSDEQTDMQVVSKAKRRSGNTVTYSVNCSPEPAACMVIRAEGVAVPTKPKKVPVNELYLPFKGVADMDYQYSPDDLAFFAESDALPS